MKRLVLIFFVFVAGAVRAQERLGITNSNYSSTNSIFLNASSSVDSRTYMQWNIIGMNAFLMTNVGYIPKFSIPSAIKNGVEDPQLSSIKLKQFLYANGSVEGPSFVISKETFGAGIFVRARAVGSLNNVPYDLVNMFINSDIKDHDEFNYRNLHFSSMSWVEYGLNFGKMIKRERNNMITLGGSLRYLTGLNLVYGNVLRARGFYNDSVLSVDNLDGKLRYNSFGWNTGSGFAMDLGITYKKMLSVVDGYYAHSRKSNCTYVDYRYKIGLSLRDLGYIKFKKGTTRSDVNSSGYFNAGVGGNSYANAFQVNFNPVTVTGVPIFASMPASLAFQFDYNFDGYFYLNTTVVKNLVPSRIVGAQSPNLLSVCPRYEFRYFEVAMPLTFQRFIYPQLGLAFRVRTFVLGFDNVFPLFLKKKTYGANIYFTIGFSVFKNKACNLKSRSVDNCAKDFKGRDLNNNGPKKRLFKRPKRR